MGCDVTCYSLIAGTIGIILVVVVLFKTFKKRIFAALCSKMSDDKVVRPQKTILFQRLNEQASSKSFINNICIECCKKIVFIYTVSTIKIRETDTRIAYII